MSYLFAISYCSWGSHSKNTEVVYHSLLQWTTFCQNCPLWPDLLGWPYTAWIIVSMSETRLWSMWWDWLVFCDCGFILSSLWWIRIKGLWKFPDGKDWLRGNWFLYDGWARFSKSLIQFSVDGWGCVPSLLFNLRPSYGGGNEDSGVLLQNIPCRHCYTQWPQPCIRPPLTYASTRDFWTLMGKSGSVSCGPLLLSPGS